MPKTEFISLRPKMYSIEKSNLSNTRKANGVVGTVVKKGPHARIICKKPARAQVDDAYTGCYQKPRTSDRCIRTE